MKRSCTKEGEAPANSARTTVDVGWLAVAICVALSTGGATCGDAATGASGAESADADASAAVDVGAAECRTLPTADQCQLRSGCRWMSVTCGGGRVVAGCLSRSSGAEAMISCAADAGGSTTGGTGGCQSGADCGPPAEDTGGVGDEPDDTLEDAGGFDVAPSEDASGSDTGVADASGTDATTADAGSVCGGYTTESGCDSDSQCRWWVGSCDGYVVREKCIEKGTTAPTLTCKSIPVDECYKQSESTCYPPNCEWVEKGCGGSTGTTRQVEGCLPRKGCRSDGDCPSGHSCVSIWLDPCHEGSCNACGAEESRCVEDSMLSP